MAYGERLYYDSGSFAFRVDDDGRIIDNMTGQIIGICTAKKNEILDDYKSIAADNDQLRTALDKITGLLETHRDSLPDELLAIISKPPTVESLQAQLAEMRQMMAQLIRNNERSGSDDDIRPVQKPGAKPANPKGRRAEAELAGAESGQSE